MDYVQFGRSVRALRRRRGWSRVKVAELADVSAATVWRCEVGDADTLTLRTITRVVNALGATASFRAYWRGENLDRLLDEEHARLVERIVQVLVENGWVVAPEVTFSIYGERGSIDVLAYHPGQRAVLVVEVKSVVPDMQAMLSGIDRKARLAPAIARERGWAVGHVSRLLVLPEGSTARRRLGEHAATIGQALPLRTTAMRDWLADPSGAVGGVMFLSDSALVGD